MRKGLRKGLFKDQDVASQPPPCFLSLGHPRTLLAEGSTPPAELRLETILTHFTIFHFFLSFFFFWSHHAACRIFPDQGSNLCTLQWKHGVLTTGPPGKPLTPSREVASMAQSCNPQETPATPEVRSLIHRQEHETLGVPEFCPRSEFTKW